MLYVFVWFSFPFIGGAKIRIIFEKQRLRYFFSLKITAVAAAIEFLQL